MTHPHRQAITRSHTLARYPSGQVAIPQPPRPAPQPPEVTTAYMPRYDARQARPADLAPTPARRPRPSRIEIRVIKRKAHLTGYALATATWVVVWVATSVFGK